MNAFSLGDIVFVARGQKTRFFEVIKREESFYWISDGHIQTKKTEDELELVCQAEDRQDETVPRLKYYK